MSIDVQITHVTHAHDNIQSIPYVSSVGGFRRVLIVDVKFLLSVSCGKLHLRVRAVVRSYILRREKKVVDISSWWGFLHCFNRKFIQSTKQFVRLCPNVNLFS